MTYRTVISEIAIDDNMAIEAGKGTIDYLESKTKNLEDKGIHIGNVFIADPDDADEYEAYKAFLFDWLFRDADESDYPDPPTFLEWKESIRYGY